MPNKSNNQQTATGGSRQLTSRSGNELEIIQQGNNFLIDARLLHQQLKVKTRFNDWITRRIGEYGFEPDKDYYSTLSKVYNKTEYLLTIDMAKELAMLENNEIGRSVRRYFIEKEKSTRGSVLPAERSLYQGVGKKVLHGTKLFDFVDILAKCGYSTRGVGWRRRSYPQHFIMLGHKLYITEWYAQYLYRAKDLRNMRSQLHETQPLLPFTEKEV